MNNKDRIQYLYEVMNSGIDFLEDLILEDDELTLEEKRVLDFARNHLIRSSTALMKAQYMKRVS